MNRICQKIITAFACAALCGCMVGPDFEKPKADALPEKYSSDGKSVANPREPSDAELAEWWAVFGDETLSSLVRRAFEKNFDLATAVAKIKQARATLGITQSGFFPSLDADAGFKQAGKISASNHSFSWGADAAWEVDIFGGTRRGIEAAVSDYKAALADKCATKISVAAEVAKNYFLYRGYQQELIITKRNLEAQRKTYNITVKRKSNGFVSDLDVVRAAAQLDSTSAQIPQLESKMLLARHALELLLALPAGSLEKELEAPRELPILESFVPTGVPAKLVRRRPDILSAENKLHAAVAKIGNAKSDFYPKFFITGQISYQAPDIGKLVQNQYGTWSAGPSASWNLFQAGKTYFNVKLQKAVAEAAGVSWNSAVLAALKEVEDAIVSAQKERERIAHINKLVESNKKAFELSSKLYSEGEIEFLDLLDTQRSMLSSEQSQVSSRRQFVSNIVSLYAALGGGWSESDLQDTEEDSQWLFFKEAFGDGETADSANTQ